MPAFLNRFRYALVAIVSLVLFVGGLVSGSAGNPFILGEQNTAGTATTSLTTSSNQGAGLFVNQDGGGIAIRADAHAGIAGSFTSNGGVAINGLVRDAQAYGIQAINMAEVAGSGTALTASAVRNVAILAKSNGAPPLFIVGPTDRPPMVVNSATRVDNLNVDATDGWSIGCPESTVLSQGLCFELSARGPATVWEAADACQALDDGGYRYRLPSVQQLRSARAVEGIDIAADGEQVDGIQVSGDALLSLIVFDDGTVAAAPTTEERAYRCVTAPLSVDLSLLSREERSRYPRPAETTGTSDPNGSAGE